MAGISSVNATFNVGMSWQAGLALTGSDYPPLTQATTLRKSNNYGTTIANALLGGADEIVSYIVSLAGAANTTIDLTTLTNIVQQTGVSLARIKGYLIRLLDATDDLVLGTACTSVTIGNAATNQFNFNNWATNTTQDIFKGGALGYLDNKAAGMIVDGTHKSVKILNNDATNTAKVQISLIGGQS